MFYDTNMYTLKPIINFANAIPPIVFIVTLISQPNTFFLHFEVTITNFIKKACIHRRVGRESLLKFFLMKTVWSKGSSETIVWTFFRHNVGRNLF